MSQDLRHYLFHYPRVHPSLILFLWLCAVLLVQRVPLAVLLAGVLATIILSGGPVRQHWSRLLKRTRWLLLILALTFLLFTPGERLQPGSPFTFEGVALAADHLLRLVAVLLAVAWLLARHSLAQIVSGLYGIARTLGIATLQRAVLRLALVLQYVERGEVGDWRRLMGESGADQAATLSIRHTPPQARDWGMAAIALFLTVMVWTT